MLCLDGSDGKNNSIQLDAISDIGTIIEGVLWSSSNPDVLTVTSDGMVSGVGLSGNPLFADSVVSATYHGTTKTCKISVFNTIPSDSELITLKGGSGPGIIGGIGEFVKFDSPIHGVCNSARICLKKETTLEMSYSFVSVELGKYGVALQVLPRDNQTEPRAYIYEAEGCINSYTTLQNIPIDAVDFGISGGYIYNNGDSLPTTSTRSDPVSYPLISYMSWHSSYRKILRCGLGYSKDQATLKTRNCERFYIPQNYGRKSFGEIDQTTIFNIGTQGGAFDMVANNVPDVWFNI